MAWLPTTGALFMACAYWPGISILNVAGSKSANQFENSRSGTFMIKKKLKMTNRIGKEEEINQIPNMVRDK